MEVNVSSYSEPLYSGHPSYTELHPVPEAVHYLMSALERIVSVTMLNLWSGYLDSNLVHSSIRIERAGQYTYTCKYVNKCVPIVCITRNSHTPPPPPTHPHTHTFSKSSSRSVGVDHDLDRLILGGD